MTLAFMDRGDEIALLGVRIKEVAFVWLVMSTAWLGDTIQLYR